MARTTYKLRLVDGRRLAYAEYGVPNGRPAFYCHGFPGSQREAQLIDPAARAQNVRIIAADRPGYGDSDPLPGRSILAWAKDLTALADHLGLDRFSLIGVSGGAPYALACAFLIPERLIACTLVCPLGPIYIPDLLNQMSRLAQLHFSTAHRTPLLSRLLIGGPVADLLAAWPCAAHEVAGATGGRTGGAAAARLEGDGVRRG